MNISFFTNKHQFFYKTLLGKNDVFQILYTNYCNFRICALQNIENSKQFSCCDNNIIRK
jgi:hypothetical protein